MFSETSFGTQKPGKKMKLVHSHKAKEDIFPNYILALLSRSDAPVLKSPSTLKRALALKAVD